MICWCYVIWYLWTDIAESCTRFQLLIYSCSITLWCLMFVASALFGATSPKKRQKIRLNTRKDLPTKGSYIYIYVNIFRYDTLYKASHPKKIQPQWITQKRRCWHVVTWSGPLCAFSSWPQTRLSRSLPLAKLPEKIRLWEIIAICPDQVIWVFPRIGGKPQNGWWK